MAYSHLADRCENNDQLEALDISLGMAEDPEEVALARLREHQEATGMTFEKPHEHVEGDGKWDRGGDLPWR